MDIGINIKKIYLSKSTLKRKLKAEGTTFSTIFLLARMKKAARLLRTNNNSIRAIAEECGFNNPSYFSTVFRKILIQPLRNIENYFKLRICFNIYHIANSELHKRNVAKINKI
ncbi:helix-turn-helix transcriptional regulator [Escherichia coli]|uniref:helix-turn-helix transcriptional regulator n=1 Tax=Escherichia coli TaxID=562 RepID=UPI0039655E46